MSNDLHETARALVAPGKGILAADESGGTIKKRFDSIGLEIDGGAPPRTIASCCSAAPGAERVHQRRRSSSTRRSARARPTAPRSPASSTHAAIIPGIKVDKGAKPLALAAGETPVAVAWTAVPLACEATPIAPSAATPVPVWETPWTAVPWADSPCTPTEPPRPTTPVVPPVARDYHYIRPRGVLCRKKSSAYVPDRYLARRGKSALTGRDAHQARTCIRACRVHPRGWSVAVVGLQPLGLLIERCDCLRRQLGLITFKENSVANVDDEILLTARAGSIA